MRMKLVGLGIVASLGVWGAGCTIKSTPPEDNPDGGSSTPGDAGAPGSDAAGDTAAPPPEITVDAPQILSAGGPVMKTPKVVPIYFANDAFQPQLQSFLGKLPKSAYWKAISAEYGVGDIGLADTPVVATEKAPTTAQDHGDPTAPSAIKTFLQDHLDGAHAGWPAADENSIYTIFYPATTTVKLDTAQSCAQFGGYHNETTVGATKIVYAILPRCSGAAEGLSDFDSLTVAASHELWEAASDPYPFTAAAFNQPDDAHLVWQEFPLPELGDMCAQNLNSNVKPAELGFTVQRMWSNLAAKHGHDPCVPNAATTPYFNAIPLFTESVPFNYSDNNGKVTTINTKGVKLGVGESKTISLQLFSDGAAGQWDLSAVDLASKLDPTGQTPEELTFDFDKKTAGAGDAVKLTITRASDASSDIGGSAFLVVSRQGGKGGPAFFWTGFVSE